MVLESFWFYISAVFFFSENSLLCCIQQLIIHVLYANVWLENLMFLR